MPEMLAMLARLGAMFERTASVRGEDDLQERAPGRGPHDRRGARLPRGGGQRLPPRLRRHVHRRRRGLGGLAGAAARLELAQRDLDAAVHAALRAQRRVLHPGRRVRLGWARRGDLRARSAAERRSRRLAAGRRAVRAAARRAQRDPGRDLGGRARDRARAPPRTSSRRWSRSRGTPRWRCRSPRTAPTTCSTSACSSGCSRCRRGWPRPRTWTRCCRPSATASRTRSASTRS